MMPPERRTFSEARMPGPERWAEIHRLATGWSVGERDSAPVGSGSETVRRCSFAADDVVAVPSRGAAAHVVDGADDGRHSPAGHSPVRIISDTHLAGPLRIQHLHRRGLVVALLHRGQGAAELDSQPGCGGRGSPHRARD